MSDFDTIHNTISEWAIAVGPGTTVLKVTPIELTRLIFKALGQEGQHTLNQNTALREICEAHIANWEERAKEWDAIASPGPDYSDATGCAWGRRACKQDLEFSLKIFGR